MGCCGVVCRLCGVQQIAVTFNMVRRLPVTLCSSYCGTVRHHSQSSCDFTLHSQVCDADTFTAGRLYTYTPRVEVVSRGGRKERDTSIPQTKRALVMVKKKGKGKAMTVDSGDSGYSYGI